MANEDRGAVDAGSHNRAAFSNSVAHLSNGGRKADTRNHNQGGFSTELDHLAMTSTRDGVLVDFIQGRSRCREIVNIDGDKGPSEGQLE